MDKYRRRLIDSYNSTKCTSTGNGRKQSLITARLRRQLNKKDRLRLRKEIVEERQCH